MKNILARGGIEFLAVFLGIALSLWVDEYQKSKEAKKLNKQILTRLHDNLEADSIDGICNVNAHQIAMHGSKRISLWEKEKEPILDSLDFHLSSLAMFTFFVNNMEEYNSLKMSGRMELLQDEELVKKLHGYYTYLVWVEELDLLLRNYINEQYFPFISQYSSGYVLDEKRNIYNNSYPVFIMKNYPPTDEINHHLGIIKSYRSYILMGYKNLVTRVSEIRRMIRKELRN